MPDKPKLTLLGQPWPMCRRRSSWLNLIPAALLLPLAAACAEPEVQPDVQAAVFAVDPVIARALHDPLMSDPDLASRNEANAAIGFIDSAALPVFPADDSAAADARAAARLELLEQGTIPDLPQPSPVPGGERLGPEASPAALMAALGAPEDCAAGLDENFALAATLPQVAAIMPRGMVVQAGGADTAGCRIRIIRYQTPALPEDVLQYHYARAVRGGLSAARFDQPEDSLIARNSAGETLVVHARTLANGMSGVDLLYRAPADRLVRVASRR